jgi:transposase-like protein
MQCPECKSAHIRKNGKKQGKQNHICVDCGRQFIAVYSPKQGYSDEMKTLCLRMSVNGTGFRAIERVTGVHHTTVITWVRQAGMQLPDAPNPETIPEVGELDELETFVGSKKIKSGFGRR